MNSIIYTKEMFGRELKKRIDKKDSHEEIGKWAYRVYLDWPNRKDNFLDFLISLSTLELGKEFEIPDEKIDKIACALICGNDDALDGFGDF